MKRDSQVTMSSIINEWQESGLSIEAFAQNKKITKTKLQYWERKLHKEKCQNEASPAFFEIGPGLSHVQITKESSPAAGKLQIELTFPSGLCLKIYG